MLAAPAGLVLLAHREQPALREPLGQQVALGLQAARVARAAPGGQAVRVVPAAQAM